MGGLQSECCLGDNIGTGFLKEVLRSHPAVSPGRPQAVDLPGAKSHWEIKMTRVRTLQGNYFIDLEHDAQRWRVVAITSLTGLVLLPPAFSYLSRAEAERYAQAAIRWQVSNRR